MARVVPRWACAAAARRRGVPRRQTRAAASPSRRPRHRRRRGDPESALYRVCAASADNVALVRQTAVRLAGGRPPADVRNIRSRFCFGNPHVLDFVIGADEALIAIPDRRSRPSLRACVVVDDPDFVTAMQDWYDEFIWEPACDWVEITYDTLDSALDGVDARLRTDAKGPATPPG